MITIKADEAAGGKIKMSAKDGGETLAKIEAKLNGNYVEILSFDGEKELFDGVVKAVLGYALRRGIPFARAAGKEHFAALGEMGFKEKGALMAANIGDILVCKNAHE